MGLYFFSKVVAQSVCILYITCSGGIDVQVNLYLDDGDVSLIKADSLVKGI